MKASVVGRRKVDYISKKTNKHIEGTELQCVMESSRVEEGMAVESIFISCQSSMFDDVLKIPIGSDVDISYNRWGSVDTLKLCSR